MRFGFRGTGRRLTLDKCRPIREDCPNERMKPTCKSQMAESATASDSPVVLVVVLAELALHTTLWNAGHPIRYRSEYEERGRRRLTEAIAPIPTR
jgi:hypothetical protein